VYGDAVRDEQEVMAHIANIIIEAYAVEGAIGRAEKLGLGGSDKAGIAGDVARVYTSDAIDRVAHAGKQVANAIASRSTAPESLMTALDAVASHRGCDTISARRRIGDAVIAAGRYPF
jgi:hypothetical protein